jgi:hypothetical protein
MNEMVHVFILEYNSVPLSLTQVTWKILCLETQLWNMRVHISLTN